MTIALCAYSAGIAQAGTTYDFRVDLDDGIAQVASGGDFRVTGLNTAQTRRIVLTQPSGTTDTGILAAGSDQYSSSFIANLAPGDKISVRQPGANVSPTEEFTIPTGTLNVVNGATALTGAAPAGWFAFVTGDYRCNLNYIAQSVGAGPFSVPYSKVLPGETAELSLYSPTGDTVDLGRHSPGETPCFEIDSVPNYPSGPGEPTNPNAYELEVSHLLVGIAPSVRLVLRRGSTVIVDVSEDSIGADAQFATRPLPGDTIDVYRPKTAPAPSYSAVLPQVSAVFDSAVDLVAFKTPAASLIRAYFSRVYISPTQNARSALDVPAGVNFLNFGTQQAGYAPIDLRPDDVIVAEYQDPDHIFYYQFEATPGDLVAPAQSIKLPSKIKLKTLTKAFKKGYKVKLKSNEAGPAKLTLAFPKAKGKKAVTLANASGTAKAGTATIALKFTKSGKKALKKLRKRSSRLATLTSTVTDASGNVSTLVKRTKIKA
jgi:hypothetical protein